MRNAIVVNKFEVEFYDDGYPLWTNIKYGGDDILRVHHSEVKDLEYALERIRKLLEAKLQAADKHEA
jgi:hypothetical protein